MGKFIVMSKIEVNTEQIVRAAARKVFTHKGFDGARMQDIADEAGINKSLLHYYFRSKDKLFEAIFQDVINTFLPPVVSILISDLPLFEKIRRFTDQYIDILVRNPDFAGFVIHELKINPQRLLGNIKQTGVDINIIKNQIEKEAEAGNIRSIKAEHFIANLISMCVFPFIARPVFIGMLNFGEDGYAQFIEERKIIVSETMINALTVSR